MKCFKDMIIKFLVLLGLIALVERSMSWSFAHAVQPIPFAEKFTRQGDPTYKNEHVWKPGEQVQAPFFSECEKMLTLTVAEGVVGGVRDIRHSDSFSIVDPTASEIAKTRDWRGMTFMAVVEIIEPITQGYIVSNMFPYRARIVSLSPPTSPINPKAEDLKNLKQGSEVILLGKVVELTNKSVTIQAVKSAYRVELRSGIPMIDSDLSGIIKNLSGDDRLQLGDVAQLKAYVNQDSGLWTHWCRSCNLEYPSPQRKQQYDNERVLVRGLMANMLASVRDENWSSARLYSAGVLKMKLTPGEIGRHKRVWEMMPEVERPIRLTGDHHREVEAVNRMFNVDLDEMTPMEFYELALKWAVMNLPKVKLGEKENKDESYIFRIFRSLNAPASWTQVISMISSRSRLDHFKKLADSNFEYEMDRDWDEHYNLEQSIGYSSSYMPTPMLINFQIDMLIEIFDLELDNWNYQGNFLFRVTDTVMRSFRNAHKEKTPEGEVARKTFASRLEDLQRLYDRLMQIPSQGPRPEIRVIGMPPLPDPTKPYKGLKYDTQLEDLYKILDIAGTW